MIRYCISRPFLQKIHVSSPWFHRLISSTTLEAKNENTPVISNDETKLVRRKKKRPQKSKHDLAPRYPLTFEKVLSKTSFHEESQLEKKASQFLQMAVTRAENEKPANSPAYELDWNSAMEAIEQAEHHYPIMHYDAAELERLKDESITFNLAKIIDRSFALKKMVDLGVDISMWEKNGALDFALRLNFEKDVVPKMKFFRNLEISLDVIADLFSTSAELVSQDIDNLQTRVDYLKSKNFSAKSIRVILSSDSSWLTFSVQEIDARLGFFQKFFSLSGNEVEFNLHLPIFKVL